MRFQETAVLLRFQGLHDLLYRKESSIHPRRDFGGKYRGVRPAENNFADNLLCPGCAGLSVSAMMMSSGRNLNPLQRVESQITFWTSRVLRGNRWAACVI